MASQGTGLPTPQAERVLVQPGGIVQPINADRYSDAESWAQIARAGARLADSAGDYAKLEIHQAKVGYLAEQDTEIARTRTDLRDKFANDPAGFDANWTAYKDGKIGAAEPWAVPHLTAKLGTEGNAGYSAVLGERRATDRRLDSERITTAATQSSSDVIGSAMAGTLQTPDGQLKISKFQSQLDTAVTSELMTKEKADFLFDDTMSKATSELAAREGVQVYREKGFDAAVEHLKTKILENETLSLKGEGRYKAFNRGIQAIKLERQIDQQDRGAIVQESRDFVARIKSGQEYSDGDFRDMHAALGRVGATAQQGQLVIEHGVRQATIGQDLNGLAEMTMRYRVGASAPRGTPSQVGAVTTAAANLGVSPRDLAAAISYETGGKFDPNIVGGKGGNYAGLIQFGPEERAKYGIRPGMSVEQQMPAVEAFLRERGVKPGMGISEIYRTINGGNPNASLNASDGNGTIAQHIQRIKAGHYAAADKFLGARADGSDDSARVGLRVQQLFVSQARATWSADVEPAIKAGKPVEDQVIADMNTAALLSGDATWIKRTSELIAARQIGANVAALPVAAGQAAVDMVRQEFNDRVYTSVQSQFDRKRKMAADDPVGLSIENGMVAPVPLDLSTPQTATASVMQRVDIARGIAQDQGVAPGNPFRPAETAALAGSITSGDAAPALQALGKLPDEFLTPALGNPDIKAAVAGAARSRDPRRFNATMGFLDHLWQRQPGAVAALFGEDQIHALMTWQTNTRYLSADEMARELQRQALDPQVRDRMKKNEAEGRTLAGKFSFTDVVKRFDTSWFAAAPGAPEVTRTGNVVIDGLVRDTMMGDFVNLYARRYAETLDKDKAAEQAVELMKTKWVASRVNGGRLMLNAPETVRGPNGKAIYPAVNGSWDWMNKQIGDEIARELKIFDAGPSQVGVDELGAPIAMGTGAKVPEWSLVSDRQTQAEVQAGKPASYGVVVTDPRTGQMHVLPRFYFDPTEAVAKGRADFAEQRRRAMLPNYGIVGPGEDLGTGITPAYEAR